MIEVTGIDHIVIRVRNRERALGFYRDVLGCRVVRDNPAGVVHLRAGTSLIDLVPVDSKIGKAHPHPPDQDAPNMDHFCLTIAAATPESVRRHLAEHGIDTGAPAERFGGSGQGLSIYLSDPDGNTLELRGFDQ